MFLQRDAYIPRFISGEIKKKMKEEEEKHTSKTFLQKNYIRFCSKSKPFVFPSINLIKLDFHSARYFNLTDSPDFKFCEYFQNLTLPLRQFSFSFVVYKRLYKLL